jgi:hypothetical protein
MACFVQVELKTLLENVHKTSTNAQIHYAAQFAERQYAAGAHRLVYQTCAAVFILMVFDKRINVSKKSYLFVRRPLFFVPTYSSAWS